MELLAPAVMATQPTVGAPDISPVVPFRNKRKHLHLLDGAVQASTEAVSKAQGS